jgi:hypothetical protein
VPTRVECACLPFSCWRCSPSSRPHHGAVAAAGASDRDLPGAPRLLALAESRAGLPASLRAAARDRLVAEHARARVVPPRRGAQRGPHPSATPCRRSTTSPSASAPHPTRPELSPPSRSPSCRVACRRSTARPSAATAAVKTYALTTRSGPEAGLSGSSVASRPASAVPRSGSPDCACECNRARSVPG